MFCTVNDQWQLDQCWSSIWSWAVFIGLPIRTSTLKFQLHKQRQNNRVGVLNFRPKFLLIAVRKENHSIRQVISLIEKQHRSGGVVCRDRSCISLAANWMVTSSIACYISLSQCSLDVLGSFRVTCANWTVVHLILSMKYSEILFELCV